MDYEVFTDDIKEMSSTEVIGVFFIQASVFGTIGVLIGAFGLKVTQIMNADWSTLGQEAFSLGQWVGTLINSISKVFSPMGETIMSIYS